MRGLEWNGIVDDAIDQWHRHLQSVGDVISGAFQPFQLLADCDFTIHCVLVSVLLSDQESYCRGFSATYF